MHEWTFVISRSPHSGAGSMDCLGLDTDECRRFENRVAAVLRDDGDNVLIVPHIYYLLSSHLAVERIENEWKNIVLASWLHPRAAYWTLKALGVNGCCFNPSESDYRFGKLNSAQLHSDNSMKGRHKVDADYEKRSRAIYCYGLRPFSSVTSCVEEMKLARDDAASTAQSTAVEEISDSVSPRWYPVLDYSRCADCRQCLEFCLFDVYSLAEKRVVASQAENCKPGCPACARLCPEGAIMFPHYTGDPAIAGAQGAKISSKPNDIASFLQPSEHSMLERPETTLADHARADSSEACDSDDAEYDDLDDLIEALDRLDD